MGEVLYQWDADSDEGKSIKALYLAITLSIIKCCFFFMPTYFVCSLAI